MRYWLGVLGIAAGDRWLEEPKAEFPQDFIERLSGELREAQADGALLALDAASADDAIARVIDARTQARRAKDWAASDRLRDALARCGVERQRHEGRHHLDRRFKRVKPQRQKSSAPPVRRGKRDELDFDDVIYGIHAVREALEASEALRLVRVALDRTKDGPLRALLALAKEQNVSVRFERRAFFERLPFQSASGRGGDCAAVPVRYARRDHRGGVRPGAA